MPRQLFTSLRAGLETTPGTGVAPTRILEFTDLDPRHTVGLIRPKEYRRSRFGFYRGAAGAAESAIQFSGNLTYNQAAWLGNLHMKAVTTGTGGAADKTYAFTPTSASDDLKRATIEYGFESAPTASQPAFSVPGCVGQELTITWDKSNQNGVSFTSLLTSHKDTAQISAFTGSPTSLTSTAISPNVVVVTIDPTTIGTTVDNYLWSAEWKLTNPFTRLSTLNNTANAQDNLMNDVMDNTLTVSRYYNDDLERDRYVDKAVRKIRLVATGPVLGSSNYKMTLDYYGVLENATWQQSDGLWGEQLVYKGIYDATATSEYVFTIITAEATIT